MNKILQKDGFFFEDSGRVFEDSGRDVKVPKSAISPNGKPKKSILKRS